MCFEGDCKVGEQLIEEMRATFRQLSHAGADELSDADVAFMQRFGPTVTQLLEQFDAEEGKLRRQVPFTVVCCNIKDLGVKAQGITRAMRTVAGVEQTSATPVSSPFKNDIGDTVQTLAWLLGGAVAASIVIPALFKR